MNPNGIDTTMLFSYLQPLHVLKWILFLIVVFYLVFLLVIFNQIRSMQKVITQPLASVLLTGCVALLTGVAIWIIAFIILIHIP